MGGRNVKRIVERKEGIKKRRVRSEGRKRGVRGGREGSRGVLNHLTIARKKVKGETT